MPLFFWQYYDQNPKNGIGLFGELIMPKEKEQKTEILGGLDSMRQKAVHIVRDFSVKLKKDKSELALANAEALLAGVGEAKKNLRTREEVPVSGDGTPYLFRMAQMLLSLGKEPLTQKTIGEALCSAEGKHRFYDSELLLLPSFLSLAAAELYAREGSIRALETLMQLSKVDFSSLFFAFSEVERIFLQEEAGVYRLSDTATRHLYHARIQRLAKKEATDVLESAEHIIQNVNREKTHIGEILHAERGMFPRIYLGVLLSLCFAFLLAVALGGGAGVWNLLLLPLVFLPLYAFAKAIAEPYFSACGERILPKIAEGEVLEKTKVLVCIATFLFGEEKDGKIFDKLEDFYLMSHEREENIVFAVVGDLPQSEKRTTDKDASILSYAEKRISALSAKYGAHFALFVRGRRRSESENAYIGWERKRGSVLELCRFLRGKKTSFILERCEKERLSEVKYLITLDADTNLYAGAVRDLVGVMLHPENRPMIDPETNTVTKGHGIIQPRMTTTLMSATETVFADMTGGAGGIDVYASAGSDFYQSLFDEGIYCGKGILDVDVFLAVCDGFFPKERILSHDLAEGCLLRAGLAPDIVLSDGTPKNAISYYIREHRWIRGDLQILPYLLNTVQNESGETIPNPMSPLSEYKILDNLLRAATPLFSIFALFLGGLLGGRAMLWTSLAVFSSVLLSLVRAAIGGVRHHGTSALMRALSVAFFRVSTLAYDAFLFADAGIRTLYRFAVSRKNFLNWTTASQGDSAKRGYLDDYILRFSPSMMIGLLFFCVPGVLTKIFGTLWMLMPFLFWVLSKRYAPSARLCARDKEAISRYTHDAWLFFRDYVTERTHGLPPDNVQFSPTYAVANRTSPTNIGLYLLSLLAARDFGYIDSAEMYARSYETAQTLKRLFKWNGHLYNWYALDTLAVLGEAFVSTVDSGNLVTALVAFCEGAKEYAGEETRLLDVIAVMETMIAETDFSALYDTSRELFYIGYHVQNGTYSNSHYDTFMSEARLTSYYAAATRTVSRSHYFKPSRRIIGRFGARGIASWSGTAFEFFMPSLLLPTVKRSASFFALSYAYQAQRKNAVQKTVLGKKHRVFGVSESGYFAFDGAMNYQYHAFGTGTLALDPMVRAEKVISPYSSFLMLEADPERIAENLSELEALGMYGKYGFYEALDLAPYRVGEGYARIQSFMAHHVGMSIVSAANLLHDGIFRKRFLKNPAMRASAELLSEKMPTVLLPYTVKKRIQKEEMPFRYEPTKEAHEPKYAYTLLHPDMAMVTNNKTKVLASSSGHIAIENGAMVLSYSDFDLYTLGSGLRVYVNIDGTVFPTVPLMKETEGFSSQFSFVSRSDAILYHSHHTNGKRTYDITLRCSVLPDRELCEIVCDIRGQFHLAHALLYFEPVMTGKREYLAHKSFSGLFLTSEYHADEGALLFTRRPRNDKLPEDMLGVKVFPTPDTGFFDTMRDRVLRLCESENDYRALAEKNAFSDSQGAVILPACVLKSADIGMKKGKISFLLGTASDTDDLLYELSGGKRDSRKLRRLKTGDLLNLQYRAAGLARSVSPLEHFVLRSMKFGQIRPHTETYKTVDKNAFWRFSISGDNPIVLATGFSSHTEAFLRFRELIGLFKYMCIRGVRYDFVICYRETDDYNQTQRKKLMREIQRAGCENFVSWSCGIFLVAENALTQEERFSYELSADAIFDLSYPLDEIAFENARAVPISAEVESLLKKEIETHSMDAEKPKIEEVETLASGSFHENGFLVQKPHGTAPFAHILASQNFGTVLTENSLGFTFARNAGLGKLTPHTADGMTEDKGERILLRIYESFGMKAYRDFDLCAVSEWVDYRFDGAVYYGKVKGISFAVKVSLLGKHDVKRMEIVLESRQKVRVALLFAVSPALGERVDSNRFYRFRKDPRGIYVLRLSDGGMKQETLAVFSPDATASYTEMAALRSDGAIFRGEADAAILVSRMELCGKKTVRFYLAAVFSEAHFRSILENCGDTVMTETPEVLQMISVKTGDILLDEITNKWSVYQALYARIYARSGFYQVSGAYGFRDQLQDALAFISLAPKIAKGILFRAAAHQYEEGDVQHFWHPRGAGLRSRCSDDLLWLAYVGYEYVLKTGDADILDAKIAYLSSPTLSKAEEDRYELPEKTEYRETLWSHMKRAVAYAEKYGEHGLPLIGSCDWNDGMNGVGREGKGESVWLAFFLILVWERMANLSEMRGEDGELYREKQERMMDALREYGFDGAWYRRGYYDDGSPLGSALREDCKIDAIAQAFAGIVSETHGFEKERALSAMQSAEAYLFDREHRLLKLLTPPFAEDEQSPGYIKGYVAGIRENGGQYTHAAVWAALGFFGCDMNDIGAEVLFAINPAVRARDEDIAKAYRIEPYVFAGDVYTNPSHMGRGGWSWYTGSAAWYRNAVIEWLCGYREQGDSFTLSPRLSARFSSFSLTVKKKNTCYHIEASRAEMPSALLDGKPIRPTHSFAFDGGEHTVKLFVSK